MSKGVAAACRGQSPSGVRGRSDEPRTTSHLLRDMDGYSGAVQSSKLVKTSPDGVHWKSTSEGKARANERGPGDAPDGMTGFRELIARRRPRSDRRWTVWGASEFWRTPMANGRIKWTGY